MAQPYIALEALFVGNARAHNAGDVVPDENVEPNGWKDSVARADSKAAKEVLADAQDSDAPQTASAQAPAPK
jgi:hypothetical protein